MDKLNDLATEKNAKLLFLIAIICLLLSPILGFALAKTSVYEADYAPDPTNATKRTILDNSTDTISQCFILEFSLVKDQVCYVELRVPYENITISFIFTSKAKYLTEAAEENPPVTENAPNTGWGISFLSSVFNAYANPAPSGQASLAVTVGEYHYIEFMGDGAGNDIWTMPGEYVIMIWGANAAATPSSGTAVSFDITVSIEGPGSIVSQILSIVGIVLLTIIGLIAIAILLDKARVRRRR